MAVPFPHLDPGNPSTQDLRAWLADERERARDGLVGAQDMEQVRRLQGRLELIAEMLRQTDPEHRPLQGVRARP